ncbi:MAG: ABC transporter ATP-binding protein [Rhodospirillales bacterium]|nr:ABC transporter ATP-binding protein [Rhodospirillales bacterium]
MDTTQPAPTPDARPDAAPRYAIEIAGLTKVYAAAGKSAAKRALDQVDLTVRRGELFGLLGPNGAGKSTLINILAGLVNKTSGTARIWDLDIDGDSRGARGAIGIVPQELNIDPFFTPRELLDVQAGLYGVPKAERRTDEILAAVGLADRADSYARTLSGGMRRRLLVAKAMVHSPPVLVLDEPTAGVDVELRQMLWAYVRELNARGTTVLLTTHYLPEVEQLCDRIAIINHGRLIACDTTAALVARLDRKELRVTIDRDLAEVPPALDGCEVSLPQPRLLVFRYRPSRTRVGDLLAVTRDAGIGIVDLSTEESDLEDIFLELTRAPAAAKSEAAARR